MKKKLFDIKVSSILYFLHQMKNKFNYFYSNDMKNFCNEVKYSLGLCLKLA